MKIHDIMRVSASGQSLDSLRQMKIPTDVAGHSAEISQVGELGVSFYDAIGREWHLGKRHVENVLKPLVG